MKRSRKQAARELLTAEMVRHRELTKQAKADRAFWLLVGGEVEWQAEQNRRRAARNERTRQHTREVVAAKRAADPQPTLWAAA